MLNYEMFMEKLKESILNLSGWNSENVSFVPHEESKFGEDRLEIVCIESATHEFKFASRSSGIKRRTSLWIIIQMLLTGKICITISRLNIRSSQKN